VDGGSLVEQRIRDELNILRDTIVKSVPVERIYLFGSYASGTPHPDSDLDLYVIMPEDAGIREIDAMKIIRRAIRDKKTVPVDVVVGKRRRFDLRMAAPTIERQIASEGVVLYG
jgi:predicted nucleotidyltransferase